MTDHMWVKYTYAPIQVEEDENGNLDTFVTDTQEQVAQEDAKFGCFHCNEPLTVESYKTECSYEGSLI